MAEQKIYRIKTKSTDQADWYLAGFKDRDAIYYAKGIIYSYLGTRYSRVFEGPFAGMKPATAKMFLSMHPGLNGYASTGWKNYLNEKEPSPYANAVLGSYWSALQLFEQLYGFKVEWVLVFSVAKERDYTPQ